MKEKQTTKGHIRDRQNYLALKAGMAIENSCVRRIGTDLSFKVFKRVSQRDFRLNVF